MYLDMAIIKTQELVMCLWSLFRSHCKGTAKTGYCIETLHTENEKRKFRNVPSVTSGPMILKLRSTEPRESVGGFCKLISFITEILQNNSGLF